MRGQAVFDNIWTTMRSDDKARIASIFRAEPATLAEFIQADDPAGVIAGTSEATGQANPPGPSPERFLKIAGNGVLVMVHPWKNT